MPIRASHDVIINSRSWFPKPVSCLSILLLLALTQGCFKIAGVPGVGDAGGGSNVGISRDAEIRVISQPEGGTRISELSCAIEVTELPGSGEAPVAIYVNWVAPCGTHKSEAFIFEGGTETYESIYSEGGYPIGMTFWATITWKDARGSHQIVSDVAACSL